MKSLFRKKTIQVNDKRVEKYDSQQDNFTDSATIENKLVEPTFFPEVDFYSLPPHLLSKVYKKNIQVQEYPCGSVKQIRTYGKYIFKQQGHRYILQEEDSGIASKELLHSFDTTVYESGHVNLVIKDVVIQGTTLKLKLRLGLSCGEHRAATEYQTNSRVGDDVGNFIFKIGERGVINIDIFAKFVPEAEMKSALEKFKTRKVKAQFVDHLRQFSSRSHKSVNFEQEYKIGTLTLDLFACNLNKIRKLLSVNIGELLNAALHENRLDAKYDAATCDIPVEISIMQLESFDMLGSGQIEDYLTILSYESGLPLTKRYLAKLSDGKLFFYDFYEPANPTAMLLMNEIKEIRIPDREFIDLPNAFELVLKHTVHDHFHYKDAQVNGHEPEYKNGVPTNLVLWEECPDVLQKGNIIYKRPLMLGNATKKLNLHQEPSEMSFVVITDTKELRKEWWEKLSRQVAISKILKSSDK